MNDRVELITQSAYARRRGVAKSAVAKAISEKRISLINGKIDPAVADIQWAQNTRARADSGRAAQASAASPMGGGATSSETPTAPESDTASGQPNYADYRTRTEKATAERAERENMREAGRLVENAQVKRGIYDSYRALRDAAMAVGQRAAPRCVGMGDARDIEQVISDELRKAFEGWEQRMLDLLPKEEGV